MPCVYKGPAAQKVSLLAHVAIKVLGARGAKMVDHVQPKAGEMQRMDAVQHTDGLAGTIQVPSLCAICS